MQKYILYHTLDQYRDLSRDTNLLVMSLRLGEWLGLGNFQERFVGEIIVPGLSVSNCVPLLEETHRKLKSQEGGGQCWYTLLNASITFLAQNLTDVYRGHAEKLKKLHEKILN